MSPAYSSDEAFIKSAMENLTVSTSRSAPAGTSPAESSRNDATVACSRASASRI